MIKGSGPEHLEQLNIFCLPFDPRRKKYEPWLIFNKQMVKFMLFTI